MIIDTICGVDVQGAAPSHAIPAEADKSPGGSWPQDHTPAAAPYTKLCGEKYRHYSEAC